MPPDISRLGWTALRSCAIGLGFALGFGLGPIVARADVLIGTNGERFVGRTIEETTNSVVFESEVGGRLVLPRARVAELVRTPPPVTAGATNLAAATTNLVASQSEADRAWLPPGVGHDGSDWVQLKSGEWLRGELKYVQDKKVEFDSDELEELTLDLKDVRKIYTAKPMYAQFEGGQPNHGMVIVSNNIVIVQGTKTFSWSRDLLTGITPAGRTGLRNWSGRANVGLSFQSGNSSQTTMSASAELAQRTPSTRFLLNYLGNYAKASDVESANNDRVNATYDFLLNLNWFARAAQLEYYYDPLANISYRLTAGVAVGHYIFNRDELEWTVSAGPGYQYTRFQTVETNSANSAQTPAAVLQSRFKADITTRLTFIQTLDTTFTERNAGQYTHHMVTTLEFEIKRHLDLNVSFVWDYLEYPQPRADGVVPQRSDYYLTVGLGVRF